ncbi:MAG: SGNH/GDSL hydrolase family protein [Candidatus Nealsonbacteria bacterium]
MTTNILIFGNSIALASFEKREGWIGRLKDLVNEKSLALPKPENWNAIYNLGVSGDTLEGLAKRFENETSARVKEEKKMIIVFAAGVNDAQFIHSQNSLRFSQEQIKSSLQKLLVLAKKFSSKIIFIGPTPVDEEKTTPIPWNPDKSYKNENIKRNNEVIKNFCKDNNLYFIEIFEEFVKRDYQQLLDDGLHPNSEGHQKIFEIVKNFLLKNEIL